MVKHKNKLVCKEILLLRNKEYKEGVTLITPTGDRPLAFSICVRYIAAQTYTGPLQWIIADDGNTHLNITLARSDIELHHIKRNGVRDRAKSITGNVAATLFPVKYDKVLIIEDDDYYRPDYIETTINRLQDSDMIGEGNSRYYNIAHEKYRLNHNLEHASLFQTAFKANVLEYLWVSCLKRDSAFIDCRLWNKSSIKKKRIFVDKISSVGIKGLPGRAGIGSGHRPGKHSHAFQSDTNWKVLKDWIGTDEANVYIQIAKELKDAENAG